MCYLLPGLWIYSIFLRFQENNFQISEILVDRTQNTVFRILFSPSFCSLIFPFIGITLLMPLWTFSETSVSVCTCIIFVHAHQRDLCVCPCHLFIQKTLRITITLKGIRTSANVKDNHLLLRFSSPGCISPLARTSCNTRR